RQGRRENSAFAYDESWLTSPACFNVSADLQLMAGHQPHKTASPHDSVFHGVIADTAPDAWGGRVIEAGRRLRWFGRRGSPCRFCSGLFHRVLRRMTSAARIFPYPASWRQTFAPSIP
ncbi:MAG: hypothetical protein LBO79_07080, partial [Zoogloeaceae bacterium]|nr:hypothetical protein [Zoogloeaceae bacterium]